jgi:hypothetical protein
MYVSEMAGKLQTGAVRHLIVLIVSIAKDPTDMRLRLYSLAILGAFTFARCQLVQIGPIDPDFCREIKVTPNLVLRQQTLISGRVLDTSGAPFENSKIELRAYKSPLEQVTIQTATTDSQGRFALGRIPAGEYRLLASPTRAFEQAEALNCELSTCNLEIKLRPTPTDMPDSQCPIR